MQPLNYKNKKIRKGIYCNTSKEKYTLTSLTPLTHKHKMACTYLDNGSNLRI